MIERSRSNGLPIRFNDKTLENFDNALNVETYFYLLKDL